MKNEDKIESVEVFDGTAWQAGIVKSLLDDAGIESFIKDGILGTLNPWWTAPGGAGAVKIIVSGNKAEEAKLIVAEFEKASNS